MQTLLSKHWHHLPAGEILELLEGNLQSGLDVFEVKHRQERFGPNRLTPKRGKSPLVYLLLQFHNPLIYILLAASAITALLKDPVDAITIFGVVLINAVIGFIQESKAEKAIAALAKTMTASATVMRSGKMQQIPATELVLGDIVFLQAGNKAPADMRLLRSRDLKIAEASLTGESMAVEKTAEVVLQPDIALADRRNMAYASTLVTYGQGVGIVTATGDHTEVGRISQLIASAQDLETPLTRKIAQFSRVLLYIILAVAVATFLIGALRGQPVIDTMMAAIALAVGAIPEGLPAAVTVTLAIGVARMARRRAVIRKLPAVETLGSTTIVCSDKTGTLTQNQMTVQQIAVPNARYEVTGSGYNPSGMILRNGVQTEPPLECLQAGLLCNDSVLIEKDGQWEAHGDPTEVALIVAARKAGLSPEALHKQLLRLDAIPFDSQHQYMATLHDAGAGKPRLVYLKGAVEVILEKCNSALDASRHTIPLDASAIHQEVVKMAAQGLRVLAFAKGELSGETVNLTKENVATGLTFLGLQGMVDPPRPEAIAAVKACQSAGVRVKMITGDHALTAAAIAQQLGLTGAASSHSDKPEVLTGNEMAAYSDAELMDAAEGFAVFARVSPEQKLRLIEALQARGHVVAMTGDGVNDAPALKQADIGVAMGITGTDVSKEAADIVLTDDNFASIEAAIEEGRGVFDNLTKFITWALPTNLGVALVILAAVFMAALLPILPVQVLWLNMTTAGALGIILAFEAKERNIMNRPPRRPDAPILTRALLLRIMLVGAFILIAAFGLFKWELANGAGLAEARTVAVNAIAIVQLFYLFNCRSLTQSIFQIGIFSNLWMIGGVLLMVLLQILFTYAPVMNQVLSSAPIDAAAWQRIIAAGLISYLIVELEKWLRRRMQAANV